MTTSATANDPSVQRLQKIQELIASGKLFDAAVKLNAAMKSAPGDARIYVLGARMAQAAGNAKGAQLSARRAYELAPDWAASVTELAFLLASQNEFKEALSLAERAVILDGNNPEVLSRVIDIAHRAQSFSQAIAWLRRAAMVASDNVLIKRLLARDLRITGQHSEALAAYNALLDTSPADAEALLGRLQTSMETGDRAAAMKDGEALLALDGVSEEYRYWMQQAQGITPARQPLSTVRNLYDGFADLYDQHVVGSLNYTLPEKVADLIAERYPDRRLTVLDLGCGTGLLGACLGPVGGGLVGVEISPRMIDQALKRGAYARIHNVDLVEALVATPASQYEVIAALDVFIYVGDVADAIPNAFRILNPGGHFIFSCEEALDGEADLVLRSTQRFAHKASHIEALCRNAGFTDIAIEALSLRSENGQPVKGFLTVARKAAR